MEKKIINLSLRTLEKKIIICTCLDFWGEEYKYGIICEDTADFEGIVQRLKERNTEIVDYAVIDAKEYIN